MKMTVWNIDEELKKSAQGKKTKVNVGSLLYLALDDYPHIQKLIADAFSIAMYD